MGAESGEQRESDGGAREIPPGTMTALLREIARDPVEKHADAWASALHPGATVGRFELVAEIGRGGLGVVWEARDRELGRPVAFKAVRAGGRPEIREERLLREAEAAASLSHPNIVTLFDVGRSREGPYLVLELLRGRTLAQRLEDGALPLRDALRIAVEVAKGLAHAHARGVVHRDLKPANVFLCDDGQVKVLDFGLAHAFGRRRVEGGTPAYMAPEQWAGAPEDERTDVFAMGVLVYQMITGDLPFPSTDERRPRAAPRLEVAAAPALGDLVAEMLRKDPVKRPRDGLLVLDALSAIARQLETGTAGTPSAARRGQAAAGTDGRARRRPQSPSQDAIASIAVLPFADLSPAKSMELPETRSYRFDRITLDMRAACMRRGDMVVPLRPKSFDVLLHLVRNPGRLVTKSELIASVWPDVAVTGNSLVQCIKEIREALGDDDQKMIETVAKRGYRFLPAVVEIDSPRLGEGAYESSPAPHGPGPSSSPRGAPPAGVDEPSSRPLRTRYGGAVAAAAALAMAGGLWWALSRPATQRTPPPGGSEKRLSVAVLPLMETAGPDETLARGIAEDVAAALGRFPDVAVASPKVVSRFQSVGASAQDLERQLGVHYLVEGGIRRSADRIRITVRLTDLPRGLLLWSQAYDEPADGILALEEEIAARIAGALAVKMTNLEARRAARRPTGSMEAYDFVLRGRELLSRLDRTAHSQARTMFERAIALDPSYSAAYVGLGRADLSAVALGWTPDAAEALKRAESLARKAIALDESSPAAHVLLGRVYARTRDYDRAVDVLRRAVALNPSDPDSHAGLGDALLWRGDSAGAIRALETAIAIDPRLSGEDLFSLGAAYFLAGRPTDAIRVLERVTTRNEGNPFVYAMLAATYAETARGAESRAATAEVLRLDPFFDREIFGSLFARPEQRERLASALRKAGL